jgi:EAL domain-containing protein (putative c-di-GMP-specific phosphodiesterase class I)
LVILDLSDNHHPEQSVINDLCKKLASAVPEALSFKSFSLNFELAFGVSITNEHSENVGRLIAHAEDALLLAQNKKQMINYFDSSHLLYTDKQLAKMESLKSCIINEQLEWYVQPQINLRSKRVIGFSLSANWQPDLNNTAKLTLSKFISTAELSGDIYLLARQMITQAFKLLFTLHQSGNYQHVSVNLSSKHLLEPDLINFIESQKERYNIPTKYLVIELSEELIFSENIDVKNFTDQLKALDIGISIANFSGSYDALRFLRKALVSRIKISCQPLIDHAEMATDKAIINALINLASTMKIPLIGTDIDNKFIEQSFSAMGGELAQGKVITASIFPEKVMTWLTSWYKQYPEANPKN